MGASNKRVTFTLSDGLSDYDRDNPFQDRDLTEDAEMILTLWRSGSLHTYPAASLSPPGSIGDKNTSAVNNLKTGERKNVLISNKIFQTYRKIKEKIMTFKCFVIKKK